MNNHSAPLHRLLFTASQAPDRHSVTWRGVLQQVADIVTSHYVTNTSSSLDYDLSPERLAAHTMPSAMATIIARMDPTPSSNPRLAFLNTLERAMAAPRFVVSSLGRARRARCRRCSAVLRGSGVSGIGGRSLLGKRMGGEKGLGSDDPT